MNKKDKSKLITNFEEETKLNLRAWQLNFA